MSRSIFFNPKLNEIDYVLILVPTDSVGEINLIF